MYIIDAIITPIESLILNDFYNEIAVYMVYTVINNENTHVRHEMC